MQFHALPSEIAQIIQAAIADLGLNIVIQGGVPFTAKEISLDQMECEISKICNDRFLFSVYLLLNKPIFGASSGLKFIDANPRGIFINIGSLTDLGLKQSALSVLDGYPEEYEIAKKIGKHLRRVTTPGVTAINSEKNIMRFNKNHRYTAGAKALEKEGVAMLPVAGGGKLVLGELADNSSHS